MLGGPFGCAHTLSLCLFGSFLVHAHYTTLGGGARARARARVNPSAVVFILPRPGPPSLKNYLFLLGKTYIFEKLNF